MKHDYTDDEIKTAWKDSELSLRAFLDALPMKSAEPGPWPGQQEAIDKAFEEVKAAHLVTPKTGDDYAAARLAIAQAYDAARPQAAEIASLKAALAESEKQFQDKVYEIACLLDERDKAQGILKDCLAVMPFGNIKTHTVENLPGRIADLASEIAAVSSENERLEAELAALRQPTQSAQPILADDGRSLGQVAFDAGNIVQKIKFPDQEIETWGESSEVHDMLEAASQAVSAVVEARMIRRMEAVSVEELEKVYWDGNEVVAGHTALKRVRAHLIAAFKGEGQAVDVNEPPQDEKQPDLSGEGEKQDPYARLKAYTKAGARIKCTTPFGASDWITHNRWPWGYSPECYEVHPDDLHMVPEYVPQAEAKAEPATKEASATFQAHGYTWTRHTPGDPMPCDGEARVSWLLGYEVNGSAPYCNATRQAKELGKKWHGIVGWRYADEPAQAKQVPLPIATLARDQTDPTPAMADAVEAVLREERQESAQPWTPAVGDTVRLKSGGPIMTVHHISKDGSIACTHNMNGAFEFATLPAACLTPVQNP